MRVVVLMLAALAFGSRLRERLLQGQRHRTLTISLTIGLILGPRNRTDEEESPVFAGLSSCGAYRDRTGDLRLAKPLRS
jgi:hypothetical protein